MADKRDKQITDALRAIPETERRSFARALAEYTLPTELDPCPPDSQDALRAEIERLKAENERLKDEWRQLKGWVFESVRFMRRMHRRERAEAYGNVAVMMGAFEEMGSRSALPDTAEGEA